MATCDKNRKKKKTQTMTSSRNRVLEFNKLLKAKIISLLNCLREELPKKWKVNND